MNQLMIPKNCTGCGCELDITGKFCKECGASIESMAVTMSLPVEMFCPNCGQRTNANDKFCRYCALDLVKAREETQVLPEGITLQQPTLLTQPSNTQNQVQPIYLPSGPDVQIEQGKNNHSSWSESSSSTTDLQAQQLRNAPSNPPSFISPAGAAFSVICFFLPWMKVSQCGITKTVSGAEIASYDNSFWLIPLMGIVSVAAYFIAKGQKQVWKARPFIIISSVFALFLLFYKYYSIPSAPEIMGQRITAADLGITLGFGSYGTIIGFIAAVIGSAFMSGRLTGIPIIPTNPQGFSAVLPDVFESRDDKLKPNVGAMLCYVLPAVLMLTVGLISSESVIILLLTIVSSVGFQVFLLKNETYKRNSLIRFHAYHSLFLVSGYYLCTILLIGIFLVTSNGAGIFESFSYIQSLIFFWFGLLLTYLGLTIFMAVKAYQSQIFKLPYIGDLAARRTGVIKSENTQSLSPTAIPDEPIFYPVQSNPVEQPRVITEIPNKAETEISAYTQTVEKPYFAPTKPIQSVAVHEQSIDNFRIAETSPKEAKEYFFLYTIGAVILSFFIITGAVVWFISYINANQISSENAKQTSSYIPSNTAYTNTTVKTSVPNSSKETSSSQSVSNTTEMSDSNKSDTSSFSSSLVGREGRLTNNANLRSASNKNASSVGIHFQGAKVRISNVEFYDTNEGLSTWYKVEITEYGCDALGNLGCGKNSESDGDEGWINARFVRLD